MAWSHYFPQSRFSFIFHQLRPSLYRYSFTDADDELLLPLADLASGQFSLVFSPSNEIRQVVAA